MKFEISFGSSDGNNDDLEAAKQRIDELEKANSNIKTDLISVNNRLEQERLDLEEKANRVYQADFTTTSGKAQQAPGTMQPLSSFQKAYAETVWPNICIDRLAKDIAGLPLTFHSKNNSGLKTPVESGVIPELFSHINPNYSPFDFWNETIVRYLSTGALIAGVEKTALGKPMELWPLQTERAIFKSDPDNLLGGVRYTTPGGANVNYLADEIFWLRNFNPENQFYGLSPLKPLMRTLTGDVFAREYNNNFFKNDATPGFLLTTDGSLSDSAYKRMQKDWEQTQGSYKNAFKPRILEGGLKPHTTGTPNKDMNFIDFLKLNREETTAKFGVPPAMVGIFEFANYANARVQQELYWTLGVKPLLLMIISYLNSTFIPEYEDNLFAEYDLSEVKVLQEDSKEKNDRVNQNFNSTIITRNEARLELGYEEILGEDEFKLPSLPISIAQDNSKQFSPEKKKQNDLNDIYWCRKDLTRRKSEMDLFIDMRKYFRQQQKRVLNDLKDFEGPIENLGLNDIYDQDLEREELFPVIKTNYSAAFDESATERFDETVKTEKGYALQIMKQEGDELIFDFNIDTDELVKFIDEYVAGEVVGIDLVTQNAIKDIIQVGTSEGWSAAEMAKNLSTEFDKFWKNRSITIARTEIGNAVNKGAFEGYLQTNLIVAKSWLTARDSKVRKSHGDAESQGSIPINDVFANGLLHPNDPNASAEENINCRCSFIGKTARQLEDEQGR